MTTIAILPEKVGGFRAVSGIKESHGRTAGEALDALTAQLVDDQSNLIVIVQNQRPDEFFGEAEQHRLTELMQRKNSGELTSIQEEELALLVETELRAATKRASNLAGGLLP